MNKELIRSETFGETVYRYTLDNGLTLYVLPKEHFSTRYAIFGTRFGSVDVEFSLNGVQKKIPAGIAHFLEHKMFESEEVDAFERYNETGAAANAYTSFDRTCYLFYCSERFYDSYDILLDFVQSPYFTEKTVAKEQGIIGQEIGMYDDDGEWQVFMNTLRGLYHVHPVRVDIAGTKESIAQITAQDLYDCHRAFYHPSNMFVCIVGDEDPDTVAHFTQERMKQTEPVTVTCREWEEPETVFSERITCRAEVAAPLFTLAFKEPCGKGEVPPLRSRLLLTLLLDILASVRAPLYKRMLDENLINSAFGVGTFYGRGYFSATFSGESAQPDAVAEKIKTEIARLRREGIEPEAFEASRRQLYAAEIRRCDNVEGAVDMLVGAAVDGDRPYDALEFFRSVTVQEAQEFLRTALQADKTTLSVVNPMKQEA